MVKSVVLFPPPFYFFLYISNLLSYIQNISSNELARPVMGTIFLVVTPHAQRERGKVIDRGVHIYIYMSVVEKKI